MRTLYLTDPKCVLDHSGKYLRVYLNGSLSQRLPAQIVGQVFVFGDIEVTTSAIRFLASNNIPLIMLTRSGHFVARIVGQQKRFTELRHAQYRLLDDPIHSLKTVHALVRSKLVAQCELLMRYRRNYPQLPLSPVCEELKALRWKLQYAESRKELRGLEGRAGAIYFSSFHRLIRSEFRFFGRTRRPPADPVNAMLSFGYRLLRLELEGQIESFGLDPYVGVFHALKAGRPALALDMMEEFRVPTVDRVVLRCANLATLTPDDFEYRQAQGCRFRPGAIRKFIRTYHRLMERPFKASNGQRTNYRRLLHTQTRDFARAIRHDEVYEPHRPRL